MNDMEQRIKLYQEKIENYLENSCFLYENEPQQDLFKAMRYSLLAGGKRLRPILVFDFCRMSGGNWEKAVPFAAAVEMVHTYSLIHDDLPCMDNDDYRRGKLTNHKVFGEATAVLAGDALLTAAFHQLATSQCDPAICTRAVEVLSRYAGETGMVGGQVLDMEAENRQCTKHEVRDIQSRKTGCLISAACQMGVLVGGGSDQQIEASENFADHLGLAFQIRDDILDVIGNAQELGKAVGVDSTKNTFVQLYGVDRCEEMVKQETETAISYLDCFCDTEFMKDLSHWLTDRTY